MPVDQGGTEARPSLEELDARLRRDLDAAQKCYDEEFYGGAAGFLRAAANVLNEMQGAKERRSPAL